MKVFAIFDEAAGAYLNPFVLPTRLMAERECGAMASDPKHQFCVFGAQFTLFMLGEWSPHEGVVEMYNSKVACGNMLELRTRLAAMRDASRPRTETEA